MRVESVTDQFAIVFCNEAQFAVPGPGRVQGVEKLPYVRGMVSAERGDGQLPHRTELITTHRAHRHMVAHSLHSARLQRQALADRP